jgi:predicted RNA-binding Zn-ribbon protein involved in translation (DUF1610 family)
MCIKTYLLILASARHRSTWGSPVKWDQIEKWVVLEPIFPDSFVDNKPVRSKNLVTIPKIDNYKKSPDEKFWDIFPCNGLPSSPSCSVKIEVLERILAQSIPNLSEATIVRAKTCIENLKKGASALQKEKLPPVFVQNTESTFNHGEEVTNIVASWIVKKFVSGPFVDPPLKNFRVNKLLAIDQGKKSD